MKKKTPILLTLVSLLILLTLAACSGSEPQADTAPAAESTTRELSPEMELMLGTVKLAATDYPVDAAQAEELLPLWKALNALTQSQTAAQAEVDALIQQITDTMTPEQLAAIDEMNLTMQDFPEVAEQLGIEIGANMSPELQATRQAARESGQMPPGGGPGMGGGMGGGAGMEMDEDDRATAIAERGGTGGGGFGPTSLLMDAIVDFLEAKTQ
jgi:hypothetical protein